MNQISAHKQKVFFLIHLATVLKTEVLDDHFPLEDLTTESSLLSYKCTCDQRWTQWYITDLPPNGKLIKVAVILNKGQSLLLVPRENIRSQSYFSCVIEGRRQKEEGVNSDVFLCPPPSYR